MTEKVYLSVEDVARHFGINPSTVYHLAQRGQLPGFKVGGQWRFNRAMLESWAADQVTREWLQADAHQTKSHKPSGQR